MDTIVNPFKQASMGFVKGVTKLGDGLTSVSDSVVGNAGKFFRANNYNNRVNFQLTRDLQAFSIGEEPQVEVNQIVFFFFFLWKYIWLFFHLYIIECKKHSIKSFIDNYGWSIWSETKKYVV